MARDSSFPDHIESSQYAGNTDLVSVQLAPYMPKIPSPQEWEYFKALLTDCFENKLYTAKRLQEMMTNAGYKTTRKTIHYHLKKWGARKYMKADEKKGLCDRLLDDDKAGRPLPPLTNNQLKRLEKYCKEKQEEYESYKTLLNLLRALQLEQDNTQDETFDTTASGNQDIWADIDDWFMVHSDECEPLPREDGSALEPTSLPESEDDTGDFLQESVIMGDGDDNFMSHAPHIITKQPADRFVAMSKLCNLSQQFYSLKLQEHQLRLHGLQYDATGGVGDASITNNYIDSISQNRVFWTKVKSGIYYLKIDNEHLAIRELGLAFPMILQLCERQPMSLLKDVFATISPIATRKRPTLRLQLLREFRQGSERKLGAIHVLTELFHILCREEGSDELSVAVLRAMLEETRRILQPQHPELFELQRTLVRLYRRIRYMTEAELSGWSLVEASENIYGKNHVNTRLALSECVYIYNDNGRYENALSIAEDILHRAQLNLGQDYPDYQSIYAMEDVAEVCDNLGRINDAIDWLRKASRAALKVWGDQSSTVHILDKLDVLHDKRYQQALRL